MVYKGARYMENAVREEDVYTQSRIGIRRMPLSGGREEDLCQDILIARCKKIPAFEFYPFTNVSAA